MGSEEVILTKPEQYISLSNATIPNDKYLRQIVVTDIPSHFDLIIEQTIRIQPEQKNLIISIWTIPELVQTTLKGIYLVPEYSLLTLPVLYIQCLGLLYLSNTSHTCVIDFM